MAVRSNMRALVLFSVLVCIACCAGAAHAETDANASASRGVGDGDEPPRSLEVETSPGSGGSVAWYRQIIAREAAREGLPAAIAEAVTAVESSYDPAAVGSSGEIGLMQLMPATARMLGFAGSNSDLAQPENNIRLGVTYLARAWRLASGDICTATMKYRAGHGETRFSVLSVNYCLAVRAKLAANGYAVTGVVPVATFGNGGAGGIATAGHGCRRCFGARLGTVNIAALNANLTALVAQVRGGK